MSRSTIFAAVLLGLFGLPFCGFGLGAFLTGLEKVAGGEKQAWVLVVVGLVFAVIGFALLGAALFGPRKVQQAERRQAERPAEPWLRRADWAQGRADSKTRSSMTSAWVFAILWNLVSAPILFLIPKEQFQRDPKVLLALLFPAVGVGLLIWAVRETLRWWEFGKTWFQMNSVPCAIGREFHGTIRARFKHVPEQGIRLKLSCVNRIVTGSGKNESTTERILWQDDAIVSFAELCPSPTGTAIPVSFRVPLDVRQTDATDRRNSILWVLEADASVPGVDYKDVFELPVFRTKETPTVEQPQQASSFISANLQQPSNPTVIVRPAGDGTEFYFPAARNIGFAGGLTSFTLAFSGISVALFYYHVLFIFPVVFGLFSILTIYMSLQMWLGTSSVSIGSSALRVRSGLLGGGRVVEISNSDVADIKMAITAQQGGASGTPYYDIQLVRRDGKNVTLGSKVRNKHEAEWLVAETKRLTGINAQRAAAASASQGS